MTSRTFRFTLLLPALLLATISITSLPAGAMPGGMNADRHIDRVLQHCQRDADRTVGFAKGRYDHFVGVTERKFNALSNRLERLLDRLPEERHERIEARFERLFDNTENWGVGRINHFETVSERKLSNAARKCMHHLRRLGAPPEAEMEAMQILDEAQLQIDDCAEAAREEIELLRDSASPDDNDDDEDEEEEGGDDGE